MAKDFTLTSLEQLYDAYINAGFKSFTFQEYMSGQSEAKTIILRHDVDLKPGNSLKVAKMQHTMGLKGTYYFRIVPESFDIPIIKEVASMGHEIGYHYEDMDICNGNIEKASAHFKESLSSFRKYYPVKTICMHGSPLSKYDNKDLWKHLDYKSFGLTGEPYFDLEFSKALYITDTGRTWNGDAYSVRDSMQSGFDMKFTTTFEIINALDQGMMPSLVMQTFHPQRWTNHNGEWIMELFVQRVKNAAKLVLKKIRNQPHLSLALKQ